MRSNFNSLLVVMAILDIGVVVTSIWDYSLVKLFTNTPIIYTYIFPYVWYPLKNIIMTWTIFLTMGLSTERYLAVCRPLLYRTLELTYSSRVRVLSYFLPSMIGSVLLNIPKFLEATLVPMTMVDHETNITSEIIIYNVTSLRLDPDYMYYYIHWTRLLITGVIPFIFLSLMNILIYNRMQQNSLSSVRSKSSSTKKAGSLAAVLIVIVLVFLVSNTPRLILNLFEFGVHGNGNNSSDSDSDYETCGCNISPAWYSVMISVSHFFLTINSSINFLIYCSVGEKFKMIVLRFCRNILATSGRGERAEEDNQEQLKETETTTYSEGKYSLKDQNDKKVDNGNNIDIIDVKEDKV